MILTLKNTSILLFIFSLFSQSCQSKSNEKDLLSIAEKYLYYIKSEDYDKAYSLSFDRNKNDSEKIKSINELNQLSRCINKSGWKMLSVSEIKSNLFTKKITYKIECSKYMETYLDLYFKHSIFKGNLVVTFDIRYEKNEGDKEELILDPAQLIRKE